MFISLENKHIRKELTGVAAARPAAERGALNVLHEEKLALKPLEGQERASSQGCVHRCAWCMCAHARLWCVAHLCVHVLVGVCTCPCVVHAVLSGVCVG